MRERIGASGKLSGSKHDRQIFWYRARLSKHIGGHIASPLSCLQSRVSAVFHSPHHTPWVNGCIASSYNHPGDPWRCPWTPRTLFLVGFCYWCPSTYLLCWAMCHWQKYFTGMCCFRFEMFSFHLSQEVLCSWYFDMTMKCPTHILALVAWNTEP